LQEERVVAPRATAPSTLNGHETIQLFRDGHGPILFNRTPLTLF